MRIASVAKAWIKYKGRDVTKQETTDTGHGVNAFNEDPVIKVVRFWKAYVQDEYSKVGLKSLSRRTYVA